MNVLLFKFRFGFILRNCKNGRLQSILFENDLSRPKTLYIENVHPPTKKIQNNPYPSNKPSFNCNSNNSTQHP